MKFVLGIAVAASLTVFAGLASAATITNTADGRLYVNSADGATLSDGASWLTAADTVHGSKSKDYRSTFENGDGTFANASDKAASYFRVHNSNTAILQVVRSNALSLLWGSVDSYNKITLRDTLTDSVLVVTLADLTGAVSGLSASLVKITGFVFDRVEFWSSGNSLEFSNVVTNAIPAPVPVPAAGLMLLGGLGGLTVLRSRRKA